MKLARQGSAANLARHLNEHYPDTLLLLARTLGARPAADSAQIDVLDAEGIKMTVRNDASEEPLELVFSKTADPDTAPRERLADLVAQARALDPAGILTSLELQINKKQGGLHQRLAARHGQQS